MKKLIASLTLLTLFFSEGYSQIITTIPSKNKVKYHTMALTMNVTGNSNPIELPDVAQAFDSSIIIINLTTRTIKLTTITTEVTDLAKVTAYLSSASGDFSMASKYLRMSDSVSKERVLQYLRRATNHLLLAKNNLDTAVTKLPINDSTVKVYIDTANTHLLVTLADSSEKNVNTILSNLDTVTLNLARAISRWPYIPVITSDYYLASGRPLAIWNLRKYNRKYNMSLASFNNYMYNEDSTVGAFQNMSIQLGNNTFIGAEFAHAFILGSPVRVAIGGYFQATGDTSSDNNIKANFQKIVTNGGNLAFNFQSPVWFVRSSNEYTHVGLFALASAGFSSSNKSIAFDSTIGFTGQAGLNFHLDFTLSGNDTSRNGQIGIDFPCTYVFGSKSVFNKMGFADFGVVQFKASFILNDVVSFYLQYPIYSTSNIINNFSRQLTGGITLSPSSILKGGSK